MTRTLLTGVLFAAAIARGQVIITVAGGGGNGLGDNGPATQADLSQPTAAAADAAGNIYIADYQGHRIRKVNTSAIITTIAGNGTLGSSGDNGPAASALIGNPWGIAVDSSGNVYFSDRINQRVRKITPAGTITTVAGTGTSGFSGEGGQATSASLFNPTGLAVDSSGNLYIADTNNNRIRKVNTAGVITTVAGNGLPNVSGNGPATSTSISSPNAVAIDSSGNLYLTEGHRVRMVNTSGTMLIIAGTGTPSFSGDGGPALSATLSGPSGVAVDSAGNVYVSDTGNDRVRKISTGGIITTFAGGGSVQGDGGPASNARFGLTQEISFDPAGNLYVADSTFNRIRRISAGSSAAALSSTPASLSFTYSIGGTAPATQNVTVSSSAGALQLSATASTTSGGGWLSVLPPSGGTPLTISVKATPGTLAVGTYRGTVIATPPAGGGNPLNIPVTFIISAGAGTITTFAGSTGLVEGSAGDGGLAVAAQLLHPGGVTVDPSGNVYIAENGISAVRKVNTSGVISRFAGSSLSIIYSGDGGPATAAGIGPPINGHWGLAADSAGNVYIPDFENNRVRKVDTAGTITTVAGNGGLFTSGDGGPATSASIHAPVAVVLDSAGNLYIAELLAQRVRKVTPSGTISTVPGLTVTAPYALAVDSANNLYVADQAAKVYKVAADGTVTTVAGNGTRGFSGDGGPATSASVQPTGIAVDASGNLFISDASDRVRKVTPAGVITTIAGTGIADYSGDGGPATNARLSGPTDVALDAAGNLYVADSTNDRIRKIAGAGTGTVTGSPAATLVANAFGESATIAPNTWVEIKGTGLAPAGHTRIWGDADFTGGRLPTQLDGVSVTVNGKAAFVYYISPTQLNILTPPDPLPASVTVQITNGGATTTMTVAGASVSPSFFVFDGVHATAIHADGSLIGPAALYPGLSTPAKPGETVILYANGMGTTSDAIVSGSTSQSGTLPSPPVVKIGGVNATVLFAGLVSPGLYQLNVVVPDSVPNGDAALTGTYGGVAMQSGVTLAVQR